MKMFQVFPARLARFLGLVAETLNQLTDLALLR